MLITLLPCIASGSCCRAIGSKILSCGMVHQGDFSQGIEGRYVRPWSLNLLFRRGFGLVVSVVAPSMLAVLPYVRHHGFDSRSRLLYIVWTNLCFSLFISLYKQLVFDHTLMRKGSVGRSCRDIGSKILSCGMVHQGDFSQGIEGHYVRPWSLNLLFRRGFGLVVSVVVPSMLAVLPYVRHHGFDSRSRLLYIVWTNFLFVC
jgi:predicted secreted protein